MDATSVDDIINYHFRNEELRYEATLAAGASVSDVNIHGPVQGNKDLALIGDALIRLVIDDQGYAEGATTAESSTIVSDRGSNASLERDGREHDLGKFVVKNPCQGEEVFRTTMASTVEGLVGAVWLDSRRSFKQVREVMKSLGIID